MLIDNIQLWLISDPDISADNDDNTDDDNDELVSVRRHCFIQCVIYTDCGIKSLSCIDPDLDNTASVVGFLSDTKDGLTGDFIKCCNCGWKLFLSLKKLLSS